MNLNQDKGNNKSLFVYIENISHRVSKDQHKTITSLCSKARDNTCRIDVMKICNPIDNVILSAVNTHKYSLVLNDHTILFEYFSDKKNEAKRNNNVFVLYNDIILYRYSKWSYHINSISVTRHINIVLKERILNVFNNLSPNLLKAKTHIVFLTSKYDLIKLAFDNNNKSIVHYTSLSDIIEYIKHTGLLINNPLFTHYTFYEIDDFTFILFTIDAIFLFDKGIRNSILLNKISISFSNYPCPIILHSYDLCFVSSEKFIYQVNISSKQSNSLSLFGDLALNFNNEKYKEMMDLIKIFLYYQIEIQKKSLDEIVREDKDNLLGLLFEQYDLHSYIENLSSIISEDNASFFINYNLNSSKLQVIIIYSIIYRKYNLLNKLIKIMNSNEENCLLFIIFIEDVAINFFSLLETSAISIKDKMKEVNDNILSSIPNSNLNITQLSKYYDIHK